jgi:hypothetical protein
MHFKSGGLQLQDHWPACQLMLQGRADTVYATEWDAAEQAALDSALAKFPADRHPPLERYVRAAACLPKKCVQSPFGIIMPRHQAGQHPSSSPLHAP